MDICVLDKLACFQHYDFLWIRKKGWLPINTKTFTDKKVERLCVFL